MTTPLSRRAALLGLSSAVALGRASLALAAAPTQRRLVVVVLRGALDGLAAVAPYGDPDLAGLRAPLVPPGPGEASGLLDLGGFYGLHPALAGMHETYRAGELAILHAVAGPTCVRSHFEAQDCLESGADHRMSSGWLNRAVAALPAGPAKPEGEAMAFGVAMPLLLRGPARAGSWAPAQLGGASPDFYAQVASLAAPDRLIGPAIRQGLRERGFSRVALGDTPALAADGFATLAKAAGEMLARPDGPRVAALELDGWDTHAAQPARLDAMLRQLDAGLTALREALGPSWRQTAILCMTEFGRTVRVNGTRGTDHGTGTVALLLGGAVAGGVVRADWPGLGPGRLFEGRDLAPTTDLRAVAKGVLARHLGVPSHALASVFPDSAAVAPMSGLIRA
ncbi:MAG: DUF1501 domain-containing protein [Acetobacteraceae bacterium]|nr:DUF1501 domain-containing protein [Acetobacteraceae bacterium]